MYSFGREVRDLKEAENIFIENVENNSFNEFLNATGLTKNDLTNKVNCEESFVLGIDDDIELEELFNMDTQEKIVNEIKQRESYRKNSLIVGCFPLYLEGDDRSINGYFLCSNAFSYSNNDKLLLLAIGLILYDTEGVPTEVKQFITL